VVVVDNGFVGALADHGGEVEAFHSLRVEFFVFKGGREVVDGVFCAAHVAG